jgi:hypothetical protein
MRQKCRKQFGFRDPYFGVMSMVLFKNYSILYIEQISNVQNEEIVRTRTTILLIKLRIIARKNSHVRIF